jgi:hypothetical protein
VIEFDAMPKIPSISTSTRIASTSDLERAALAPKWHPARFRTGLSVEEISGHIGTGKNSRLVVVFGGEAFGFSAKLHGRCGVTFEHRGVMPFDQRPVEGQRLGKRSRQMAHSRMICCVRSAFSVSIKSASKPNCWPWRFRDKLKKYRIRIV